MFGGGAGGWGGARTGILGALAAGGDVEVLGAGGGAAGARERRGGHALLLRPAARILDHEVAGFVLGDDGAAAALADGELAVDVDDVAGAELGRRVAR